MHELSDTAKRIYGKVMIDVLPMFEHLNQNEQHQLVNKIAQDLLKRIEGEYNANKDKHIVVIDAK